MIKNIIHNNERLEISFNKEMQMLCGNFSNRSKAFILIYHIFGNSVKICDFKVYEKRKGLGTNVLTEFELIVRKNGYKEIYGELVNNPDYSPPKVLIEFYRKLGFEIKSKKHGMQFAEISKRFS